MAQNQEVGTALTLPSVERQFQIPLFETLGLAPNQKESRSKRLRDFVSNCENIPPGGVWLKPTPADLHTTVDVIVHSTPGPGTTLEQTASVINRSGARTVYGAVEQLIPSAYVTRWDILRLGID